MEPSYYVGQSRIEKLPTELIDEINKHLTKPADSLHFKFASRTLESIIDSWNPRRYLQPLDDLCDIRADGSAVLPDGDSETGETLSRSGLMKSLKVINAIGFLSSANEKEIPRRHKGFCFDKIIQYIAKSNEIGQTSLVGYINAACEAYTKLPEEHRTPERFNDLRACIYGGESSTGENIKGLGESREEGLNFVPLAMHGEGMASASINDESARRTGYQDIVARIHGGRLSTGVIAGPLLSGQKPYAMLAEGWAMRGLSDVRLHGGTSSAGEPAEELSEVQEPLVPAEEGAAVHDTSERETARVNMLARIYGGRLDSGVAVQGFADREALLRAMQAEGAASRGLNDYNDIRAYTYGGTLSDGNDVEGFADAWERSLGTAALGAATCSIKGITVQPGTHDFEEVGKNIPANEEWDDRQALQLFGDPKAVTIVQGKEVLAGLLDISRDVNLKDISRRLLQDDDHKVACKDLSAYMHGGTLNNGTVVAGFSELRNRGYNFFAEKLMMLGLHGTDRAIAHDDMQSRILGGKLFSGQEAEGLEAAMGAELWDDEFGGDMLYLVPPESSDHYNSLGLAPTASQEQIHSAFYAKTAGARRGSSDPTLQRWIDINIGEAASGQASGTSESPADGDVLEDLNEAINAYRVLTSPRLKDIYDKTNFRQSFRGYVAFFDARSAAPRELRAHPVSADISVLVVPEQEATVASRASGVGPSQPAAGASSQGGDVAIQGTDSNQNDAVAQGAVTESQPATSAVLQAPSSYVPETQPGAQVPDPSRDAIELSDLRIEATSKGPPSARTTPGSDAEATDQTRQSRWETFLACLCSSHRDNSPSIPSRPAIQR